MVMSLIVIALLGSIILLANAYDAKLFHNRLALNGVYLLVSASITLIGGLVILMSFSDGTPATGDGTLPPVEIPTSVSIPFFIISLIATALCLVVIFSQSFRTLIQKYIVLADGNRKRVHADSAVHTLAIILMIFASVFTVSNFILIGGIDGLAESIGEIGSAELIGNLLMYVVISLIGVGIFVRRNVPRTLRRLGIRLPENGDYITWVRNGIKYLVIGAVVGFGMFWLQVGMTFIWQSIVPPETLEAQSAASQALFSALSGSLWLGFLVAFSAGVGEELLFRGALQPIFGNIIVSIFFVMLHSQYILTPASIIIFIVSIVFGFLRTQYTTPSAMMAHFVYNFTPFMILAVLQQYGVSPEILGF